MGEKRNKDKKQRKKQRRKYRRGILDKSKQNYVNVFFGMP